MAQDAFIFVMMSCGKLRLETNQPLPPALMPTQQVVTPTGCQKGKAPGSEVVQPHY